MKSLSNIFRRSAPEATPPVDDEKQTSEKDIAEEKMDEFDELQEVPVLMSRAYDLMAANLFQKASTRGHVLEDKGDAVFLRKGKNLYV
jgi:hypothetical protein